MRKVRMAAPRRAAQGVPATRKVPMARRLCEARTVALLPSVRMAEPLIVPRLWPSMASGLWRSGLCRRRLQAMGRGTLLRCRCRGRDTWHHNRCLDATTPTVTSLVLVLVEPSPQPGVLGLLCPIGDEIPKHRQPSQPGRELGAAQRRRLMVPAQRLSRSIIPGNGAAGYAPPCEYWVRAFLLAAAPPMS